MSTVAVRPAVRLAPAPLAHVAGTVTSTRPAWSRSPLPAGATSPAPFHQTALDLDFEGRSPAHAPRDDTPAAAVPVVVQGILEVLDGRRSPVALQRVVAPDVLARLARASARRRGTTGRRPPSVVRLRITAPAARLCECAAVVVLGGRVQAVALRLRQVGNRWVVDALDLG